MYKPIFGLFGLRGKNQLKGIKNRITKGNDLFLFFISVCSSILLFMKVFNPGRTHDKLRFFAFSMEYRAYDSERRKPPLHLRSKS